MKIKLLSDLHLEFYTFVIPYDGEDLLILAGDISPTFQETLQLIDSYLDKTPTTTKVILVLGNHDYYGHLVEVVDAQWKQIKRDRFYFLQDDSVVINGYRFHGATMWTDMLGGDPKAMENCRLSINDFRRIQHFSPEYACRLHYTSRRMLSSTLGNSPEPVVVITHHLPSYKSIDPEYTGSAINPAFASTDLDDLIHHEKVKLWCHGHTHKCTEYMDGNTMVLCNPRGYIKKFRGYIKRENKRFDEHQIFELN